MISCHPFHTFRPFKFTTRHLFTVKIESFPKTTNNNNKNESFISFLNSSLIRDLLLTLSPILDIHKDSFFLPQINKTTFPCSTNEADI